jgi:trimeric autotransporter adhesin
MNFMRSVQLRAAGALCVLAGATAALAQQYTISTVAGGAPPATPAAATSASIGRPNRVAVDPAGTLYFSSLNTVFSVNASGTLSVVAGNSRAGFSGDGGPAASAQLNNPQGIAVDAAGNVYIADSGNNRVRVVSAQGIIDTFAGNGQFASASGSLFSYGDGGPATQAQLHQPSGVAVDTAGNVYIADTADNVIRKVTTDGVIATVAGNSYPSYSGDNDFATKAELLRPGDVAVDSSANIYIADSGNARIRKVTSDGKINTIVGSGTIGYSGDGGVATKAALSQPMALALDASGNIYIAENGDSRIRKVDSKGNISTLAGNGTAGPSSDGADATKVSLNFPTGVAVDGAGNVYIADTLNLRVRKVASGGAISTAAGNGNFSYSGDGLAATRAQLNSPEAVAADLAGNLYIADTGNNVVRRVASDGTIASLAGNGQAGSAAGQLNAPQGLAVDASGNVYIADTQNARVVKVAAGGAITTVAGNGTPGYGGDGGAATGAQLSSPMGLAADTSGNLYIADFSNSRVRKVASDGTITTVAGNGSAGYSGDGGPAANAQLNLPQDVAVDAAGNLYIADTGNTVIRRVTSGGAISTVAGTGFPGFSGDGGQATSAQLGNPTAVAADAVGNVYIADSGRIRRVLPGGIILTIAGTGVRGYSGDGGPAAAAALNAPSGIASDASGNLFVADTGNNAVRLLQPGGSGVTIQSVVNGASNLAGAVSPGEVVVLYGSGMGPGQLVQYTLGSDGKVGTNLAGTSVFFNGMAAPVIYTSGSQVGAVVPYSISGANASVTVVYQGQSSAPVTVPVADVTPGVFTSDGSGQGQAVAINVADSSINGSAHPANSGSYVSLYATGVGQTNPPGTDGLPGALPLPLPNAKVTVTIGGKDAFVQFDGGAPGIVAGVIQINAQVPAGLPAGPADVVVQVGGVATQAGVTLVVSGN